MWRAFLTGLLALAGCGGGRKALEISDQLPPPSLERPRFLVDAGTYLGPEGPAVQLAFQVPYRELFFRPVESGYRAEFDLVMVLFRGDDQLGGELWNEAVEVAEYDDTRSGTEHVTRVYQMDVPSSEVRAEITLREARAGRENRISWDVEIPAYRSLALSLSSLWMTDCPDTMEPVAIPPRSWRLQHRLGEPLRDICVVGEVYRQADADGPIRLRWRIVEPRGEELRRGEEEVNGGSRIPFRLHPDISSLWLGSYVIEVTASSGEHRAQRSFEFQVDESTAALEMDPERSLELIGLIATDEEERQLKAASPVERKEAWNRFWKGRDPSPGTPENEFKEEFFRRVQYADETFSSLGPGWRTDRGRIYIQYGPPDNIDTYPYNIDSRPYEVWTYTSLGRRFVFVDYDGFGRYELARPGRP